MQEIEKKKSRVPLLRCHRRSLLSSTFVETVLVFPANIYRYGRSLLSTANYFVPKWRFQYICVLRLFTCATHKQRIDADSVVRVERKLSYQFRLPFHFCVCTLNQFAFRSSMRSLLETLNPADNTFISAAMASNIYPFFPSLCIAFNQHFRGDVIEVSAKNIAHRRRYLHKQTHSFCPMVQCFRRSSLTKRTIDPFRSSASKF